MRLWNWLLDKLFSALFGKAKVSIVLLKSEPEVLEFVLEVSTRRGDFFSRPIRKLLDDLALTVVEEDADTRPA